MMSETFAGPRIYVLLADLWHPPAFYAPLTRACTEQESYLLVADLFSPASTTVEEMVAGTDRVIALAQRATRLFSTAAPTVIAHGAAGLLLPVLARRWQAQHLTLHSLICCNAWLPAPGERGLDTLAPPLAAALDSQLAHASLDPTVLPYALFRRYWLPEVGATEEEATRCYTQLVACRGDIIRSVLTAPTPAAHAADLAALRVPKVFLHCAPDGLDPAAEPLLANWYLTAQQLAPSFSVLPAALPHEAPATTPRYFAHLIEQARADRGLPFSPAQPESSRGSFPSPSPTSEQKRGLV